MRNLNLYFLSIIAISLLSACSPSYDLQGYDPHSYYSKNPIENKMQTKTLVQEIKFSEGKISDLELNQLKEALADISPVAVESINLHTPTAGNRSGKSTADIKNFLNNLGYYTPVNISASRNKKAGETTLEIKYLAVISPDCPDWKKSPVTTYSNSTMANFACASTVNLGAMVADPHDLLQGKSSQQSVAQRSAKVLSDYKSGAGATASTAGGSDGTSASGQ